MRRMYIALTLLACTGCLDDPQGQICPEDGCDAGPLDAAHDRGPTEDEQTIGSPTDSEADAPPVACDAGETRPCGVDVGVCRAGVETCVDGVFGPCEGANGPGDEACEGLLDEDCDGRLDEGCGCTDGSEAPCGLDLGECVPGVRRCADGMFGPCVGAVEPAEDICNTLDDDCDGLTDEDWSGPCAVGDGACARDGEWMCLPTGERICSAEGGQPEAEACDAVDNDCDGAVDEGTFGQCTTGQGACIARGDRVCVGGALLCNADAGAPAAQDAMCNHIDDDCDGVVDEGSVGCGQPPTVTIVLPAADAPDERGVVNANLFDQDRRLRYADVEFVADADDPEDGPLDGASVVWHTDQVEWQDALLGRGERIMVRIYAAGCGIDHRITVTVTDSDGNSTTAIRVVRTYVVC